MTNELLLAYTTAQLSLLVAIAFVAGLARGFSGFGAALIFVPLASAVVGPKIAAPVLLVIDAVTTAALIPNAWRLANRREVGVMALGAFIGVPLGTYILAQSDPLALRWAISVLVAALLLLIVSGWRYRGRIADSLTAGFGLVSGVLSGAAQVGGPPVVAYWLGGAANHREVRANIILYFAVSTVFSAASYLLGGLIQRDVLLLSALTTPFYAAGLYLGARLFGQADERLFRRICYGLIALAALLGLPLWDALRP